MVRPRRALVEPTPAPLRRIALIAISLIAALAAGAYLLLPGGPLV